MIIKEAKQLNHVERKILFSEFMKLEGEPIVPINVVRYLEENDFFRKPAAIKYHGNYTGGLFDHSLAVAETLVKMTKELDIKNKEVTASFLSDFDNLDTLRLSEDNHLQSRRSAHQ